MVGGWKPISSFKLPLAIEEFNAKITPKQKTANADDIIFTLDGMAINAIQDRASGILDAIAFNDFFMRINASPSCTPCITSVRSYTC